MSFFPRRDNEEVSVGSTGRSRVDNMCFLTIKAANRDHAGDWECEVRIRARAGPGPGPKPRAQA